MNSKIVRVWLKLSHSSFWGKDYAPKRCTSCGSKRLDDVTQAIDGGCVSEFYVRCEECNSFVQEWAYGYYNPSNTEPEPWWHLARHIFKGA